jgi:hypothetical protein
MKSRCCLCVCLCIALIVARQRLGQKSPNIVARQRLGRNVTAVTNTHATIEEDTTLHPKCRAVGGVKWRGKHNRSRKVAVHGPIWTSPLFIHSFNNRRIVGRVVFNVSSVVSRKVGDLFFPELLVFSCSA